MYKLGLTSVTFRELSIEKVAQIAEQNTMDYIEWGSDVHVPCDDEKSISRAKEATQNNSFFAFSYGTYYRLGENDFEKFEKICSAASSMGMKYVRIWQGSVSSQQTDKSLFENMVEETKKLSDIAEKYSLVVAFEFHNKTNNDNAESCIAFLKAVDRENVKTYWQPLGNRKKDTEYLKAVLPYVVSVHVFHWNKWGKRYSLKRGQRIWRKWIDIIAKDKGDMNFTMEFVKNDSPKQFEKDAKILKKILDSVYKK